MKTIKLPTPRRRGELIELLFLQKATSLGFQVSKPVCEESYDFVVDSGDRLTRVQVSPRHGLSRNKRSKMVSRGQVQIWPYLPAEGLLWRVLSNAGACICMFHSDQ
jgi:PD-(D/E)XK endonuclease